MNTNKHVCNTSHILVIEDRKKNLLDFNNILNALNFTYSICTCEQVLQSFNTVHVDIIICSFYPHKCKIYLEILEKISTKHNIPIILLLQEKACYPTEIFIDINYKLFVETLAKEELSQYLSTLIVEMREPIKVLDKSPSLLSLDSHLFVKDKNKLFSIFVKDILWIEAFDNYTLIITAQQKFMTISSFSKILEQLPKVFFIRIHRSFAVQLSQIKRIEDNSVYILEKPLPISKTYKDILLKQLYIL